MKKRSHYSPDYTVYYSDEIRLTSLKILDYLNLDMREDKGLWDILENFRSETIIDHIRDEEG